MPKNNKSISAHPDIPLSIRVILKPIPKWSVSKLITISILLPEKKVRSHIITSPHVCNRYPCTNNVGNYMGAFLITQLRPNWTRSESATIDRVAFPFI